MAPAIISNGRWRRMPPPAQPGGIRAPSPSSRRKIGLKPTCANIRLLCWPMSSASRSRAGHSPSISTSTAAAGFSWRRAVCRVSKTTTASFIATAPACCRPRFSRPPPPTGRNRPRFLECRQIIPFFSFCAAGLKFPRRRSPGIFPRSRARSMPTCWRDTSATIRS